jgi:SAM-dependent methyltransferase
MIDINKTLDIVKLKFYNEWIYSHIYDEGETDLHKRITSEVTKTYVDPLTLPKDSKILNIGCGVGYFLDEMKSRGYTDVTGITLSEANMEYCVKKGHNAKIYDPAFLPHADGFIDEGTRLIFARHILHHSPYPIFNLIEYNRLLELKGKLYIEVPVPDCERKHEYNANHYSILGAPMLNALLQRTGFKVEKFNDIEFDINATLADGTETAIKEKYYCILATKITPLDIK